MKKSKKILEGIISDIVEYTRDDVNLPGLNFCHYTSPESLERILLRDRICLRFTRSDCLNDASEGIQIEHLFTIACKMLQDDDEISERYYEFLINVKTIAMQNYEKHLGNSVPLSVIKNYYINKVVYLCCFSYMEDSLPMWNYYVKSNRYRGYSISFSKEKLNQGVVQGGKKSRFVLASVIYDFSTFEEISKKLILKYREIFEIDDNKYKADVAYLFFCFLEHYKYIVKNRSFQHENEARIIARIDKDEACDIHYDLSMGFPIPFILVDFEKEAFHHIIIGPLPEDKELTQKNTEEFLAACGYPSKSRVKNSTIPIRY